MKTTFTLALTVALLAQTAAAQNPPPQGGPPGAQMGPGRGPMQQERKLVDQFDSNGDKRLDTAERNAARAFLATQPQGGRGGRGGPGGAAPGGRGPGGRMSDAGPAAPGVAVTPADVKAASTPLYDAGTLRTLFLTFENADWEAELVAFNNSDVEVPATLIVDGSTYREVGVHFRGASSFMNIPNGYKRSLNLSVDFVHENQAVRGYRTLNLLNANDDPTLMRTVLYQQIAREYIPAPKANFVRVVINGENWGVYASAQQFNKEFVKENFGTTEGARWKVPGGPNGRGGLEYLGTSHAAYKQIYEIKSKDTPKSWTDLAAFTRVLNETPVDQLEAALAPIFDVDGALRFLALEIALVNADGYWVRSSDYNIYQDTTGKFHIIPHDANETFSGGGGGPGGRGGAAGAPPNGGGRMGRMGRDGAPPVPPGGGGGRGGRGGGGGGGVTLDPFVGSNDATKPVISRLLSVPALRQRYAGYVRDIATKWLDWQKLEPIVRQYQNLIAAEVKLDTKKLDTYDAFVSGIDAAPGAPGRMSLKAFADQRRAFLLAHPDIRQ